MEAVRARSTGDFEQREMGEEGCGSNQGRSLGASQKCAIMSQSQLRAGEGEKEDLCGGEVGK